MSSLTRADVEKIAQLARIELTAAELEQYQINLSDILDYIDRLKELDLAGIPPTTHAVSQHNITREDIANSELSAAEALANAAAQANNQFAIQAVLDD